MVRKIVISAALTAVFALGFGSAASAIPSPSPSPYTGQETQANTAAPGATVTFTSEDTGLPENSPIVIEVDGPTTVTFQSAVASTSSTTVNADGTFTFGVIVPANAPAGAVYEGTASGELDEISYELNFTITVVTPAADGGAGLPNTGPVDTSALLWFGAGALALGIAAVTVVAAKRRKTAV